MSQQHPNLGRSDMGLHYLPFRPRSRARSRSETASIESFVEKRPSNIVAQDAGHHKLIAENPYYSHRKYHMRSPTASSISSVMSGSHDSTTTRSLASPISTSYASDCLESLTEYSDEEDVIPIKRSFHRPQGSYSSCFTFFDDDSGSSDKSPHTDPRRDPLSRVPSPENAEDDSAEQNAEPTIKEEIIGGEAPNEAFDSPTPQAGDDCDVASTVSDDSLEVDARTVLDITLQMAYGFELCEATIPIESLHLTRKFIRDLGQLMYQTPLDSQNTMNTSSMSTPSQGSSSESQRGGKRKKQGGKPDEGVDETSEGEGAGDGPTKRPKPNPKDEENLRLSCPFRKRNPHRFNVRDHHSCAMTYFPKFAELRQHIVKQHKRDDPSAFMCDRCNCDFPTRKELRDHQRLPKEQMCDIAEHDPESGIDGPTANKLLSRKRASGASPEVQWREIWNIIFPDDEDARIHSYHFTPVIEHFELSSSYLVAFQNLEASLRNMMTNPNTLDTLAMQFQQCFIETVQQCTVAAQRMPYTNRSNKKNEPLRTQNSTSDQSLARKEGRDILPRPDSGVVMDDGSDESGSTTGGGADSKEGGRRTSQISKPSPRNSREALQPQASFELVQPHFLQLSPETLMSLDPSTIASVSPATVQAWSDGLPGPSQTQTDLVLPEYFIHPAATSITPAPDLTNWNTSFYQDSHGPGMDDFQFDGRPF